jgi:hypothetical protein
VNSGVNSAADLGRQRCGDHDDRGDSTNYRKLAEHNLSLPWALITEFPLGRVINLSLCQAHHGSDKQIFGAE